MAVPPKALFENPTAFGLVSLSGELQALAAAVGSLGFISRAVQAPLLLAGEVNGAPWGEIDDVWGLGFSTGVVGKPEAVPPCGGMRWTLSCAVSPQEDLAEGRAHGLPERGVLPSPGHRPSLRHRTSRLLHRHR